MTDDLYKTTLLKDKHKGFIKALDTVSTYFYYVGYLIYV